MSMASRRFVTVHRFAMQDEDDEAYLRSFDNAAAGDSAEDGTSLDVSNSSYGDDGDYSEDDDDEYAEDDNGDDDYDEEGFDYHENDDDEDEDGSPSITSGGNLRDDTYLDCSNREDHSLEGSVADEKSNYHDNSSRRNSYSEQPTEQTNSCSQTFCTASKYSSIRQFISFLVGVISAATFASTWGDQVPINVAGDDWLTCTVCRSWSAGDPAGPSGRSDLLRA